MLHVFTFSATPLILSFTPVYMADRSGRGGVRFSDESNYFPLLKSIEDTGLGIVLIGRELLSNFFCGNTI